MQIITGRILKLLRNSAAQVNGFALDSGVEVYFTPNEAKYILAIAAAGSLVTVHTCLRSVPDGGIRMEAVFVANLDSKQSASFYAPTASRRQYLSTSIPAPPRATVPAAPSLPSLTEPIHSAASQTLATRHNVADEMERAYDVLHRIQAILAYLKMMMKEEEPMIGHYLDEAQHIYVQALSRYQSRDFEGAREFAAASSSLSRVVEILILRAFHSDTNYSKLVSLLPERLPAHYDAGVTQQDLDRIERLLARIRWVTENGTLPSEDRVQVQKLSLWSESFHRCARHLLKSGTMRDATEFARAADAAACSAEHICKKCYVTRVADSRSAAAMN